MKRKLKYPISELLKPLGEKKWQGNVYGARFDGQIIMNVEKEVGPAPSPSVTPSVTPTQSITPSITPTQSITPSITPTPSVTPSITPTPSQTLTPTPTPTPSATPVCNPFDPSYVTTFMWYDAADATTITQSGGTISKWEDKSGNGYDATQVVSAEEPSTGSTLNGLDTIYFDGTGKNFDIPNVTLVSDFSIYVVAQKTGREDQYNGSIVISNGTADNLANWGLFWGSGANNKITYYDNGDRFSNTEVNQNQYYISSALRDTGATQIDFWLNGNDDGQNVTISGAGTTFSDSFIGTDQYGANFAGNIAEIIVIASYQSDANRQKIEGYLAWKWGLEGDLPNDHPYKNSAPCV